MFKRILEFFGIDTGPRFNGKTRAQWRALWIEALESGDYKQAKGRLRNDDGFCCLGVAADIYDSSRWRTNDYGSCSYCGDGEVRAVLGLPSNVADAFGIQSEGVALHGHNAKALSHLNDTLHFDFDQIAAVIRDGRGVYWID